MAGMAQDRKKKIALLNRKMQEGQYIGNLFNTHRNEETGVDRCRVTPSRKRQQQLYEVEEASNKLERVMNFFWQMRQISVKCEQFFPPK